MTTPNDDGFFSRWSRRKVQARTGEAVPEPAAPVAPPRPTAAATSASEAVVAPGAAPESVAAEAPPPPTLEDTEQLTPSSDFRRFVAKDVPSEVRNAAVKKLFADPHFNAMDGLDIYIDDYSKPSPLSATDMAKMVSAQFLKLVDDPEDKGRRPVAAGPAVALDAAMDGDSADSATEDTRASDAVEPEETHDDHADLQLQPDHAPGRESPGPGAG